MAHARAAVVACVRGTSPPAPPRVPAHESGYGAFVTLSRRGELRGCVGQVEPQLPLGELVGSMAAAAARDDPRFPPLLPEELEDLDVHVSVLSAPARSAADLVVPGRDGIVVRRGARQAVLLPQVATQYGWGRETLLSMACRKAGLPEDAWRDPETVVLTFRAQNIPGEAV